MDWLDWEPVCVHFARLDKIRSGLLIRPILPTPPFRDTVYSQSRGPAGTTAFPRLFCLKSTIRDRLTQSMPPSSPIWPPRHVPCVARPPFSCPGVPSQEPPFQIWELILSASVPEHICEKRSWSINRKSGVRVALGWRYRETGGGFGMN